MCGEKNGVEFRDSFKLGSPPRVRGKDAQLTLLYYPPRITPACAGKSHHICKKVPVNQDHPRVCGEKKEAAYP